MRDDSRSPALQAAHLLTRLERISRDGTTNGLNPAQWEALRYLSRANRFSRTPAALADYLGSTRGTVSQTLIALEGKGLVQRRESTLDRRSVDLELTPLGTAALAEDPLLRLAADVAEATDGKVGDFTRQLEGVLRVGIARNRGRAFGACESCTHFRRDAQATGVAPHRCALLDVPLSNADSVAICVENVPA